VGWYLVLWEALYCLSDKFKHLGLDLLVKSNSTLLSVWLETRIQRIQSDRPARMLLGRFNHVNCLIFVIYLNKLICPIGIGGFLANDDKWRKEVQKFILFNPKVFWFKLNLMNRSRYNLKYLLSCWSTFNFSDTINSFFRESRLWRTDCPNNVRLSSVVFDLSKDLLWIGFAF